jgi:hypothetical protein
MVDPGSGKIAATTAQIGCQRFIDVFGFNASTHIW